MSFNANYFLESLVSAICYIPVTLKVALISYVIGLTAGLLISLICEYRIPVISRVLSAFVTVYMGLPLVVALLIYQLIFLTNYQSIISFFGIDSSTGSVDITFIGCFVLSLSVTCSICETFRGAFKSVSAVQYEAGCSIGLSKSQIFRRIMIPQMIPVAVPGLVNRLVDTIKGTNLVAAISVVEVMAGALIPCARTYSYLEGYLAAAAVYWALVIVAEQIGKLAETYTGKFRRNVV